jgi:CRISPR-associated endonuclease/helicase Cas3
MDYIAHVKKLEDGRWAEPQSLLEHLNETALLAAKFAENFDSTEWAHALGMCHDVGKGTIEWQNYICAKSGFEYDEEASSETVCGKIEHSSTGAKLVEDVLGVAPGRFLSYAVAGHHTGLPDFGGAQSSLQFRLQNANAEKIASEFKSAPIAARSIKPPWKFSRDGLDLSLWIRMLFSCLIDADRLNTEAYMDFEKSKARNGYLPIDELIRKFNFYMDAKVKNGDLNDRVYQARQRVLADCVEAARMEPGFFSLTVPTGGGKTLASMAFALNHAKERGKKRIIYVIPYTSIIEQNADVFRDVFGANEIVEHHANLDDEDSTLRSRLATENWDAPIIVTTNVQFFESLFAAKTSRCRKLHNIANSVVILDEAQLIPEGFLEPILETMRLLVEHYKVTFVICTATQPMFERRDDFPQFRGLPKGSIREIIKDVPSLYKSLERVKIEIIGDKLTANGWGDLAAQLASYDQVLCVVSDRKSCRELHALMPEGTYHLSALMCAEHRSAIIAEIKEKLLKQEKTRVISTQLVEAGVDIDFANVYRAKAGLDSIAQAAGRCNREGKLNAEGKLGKVVIFDGVRQAPVGILRKASQSAQAILERKIDNPIDQSVFADYFAELYWKARSLDKNEIMQLLKPDGNKCEIKFRSAAEAFKIIDDKNQQTVLVRYKKGGELIDALKKANISNKGFEINMLRKLQRYAVTIYANQFIQLRNSGSLEEIIPGVFALNNDVWYDDRIGLRIDEISNNPSDYMV